MMPDLYEWSANRPEWAELRDELEKQHVQLNARSNGSFDAFLGQQPEVLRKRWEDFFSAYLADQATETTGAPPLLSKGQKDPLGRTVRRIHADTDEFVIYCADDKDDPDDSCTLSHLFKPGVTNERARAMRAGLCPISAQIYRLSDCVESMKSIFDTPRQRRERERAFELMGRAMVFGLEGQTEQAKAILSELEAEIILRRDSQTRMRYIFATTASFTGILLLGLILKYKGAQLLGADLVGGSIGENSKTLIIDVLMFGALGAFFSVVYDIKSVKVHHAITFPEMVYAGAIRIPVGVIAAAVVILLISGQWLLGGLDEDPKSWSLLLLGFVAGFSEMFVPNALKNVEERSPVSAPGASGTGTAEKAAARG